MKDAKLHLSLTECFVMRHMGDRVVLYLVLVQVFADMGQVLFAASCVHDEVDLVVCHLQGGKSVTNFGS